MIISVMLLRKKYVDFEHYIWVLLPVDMYGISIAGAVIKPYMLFSLLLLFRMLHKKQVKIIFYNKWVLMGGFLSVFLVFVNLINNPGYSSAKAALLVWIVWFCSVIYLTNCGENTASNVPDVLIATGVGYGLVFILGYALTTLGLTVPGVLAGERTQPGFFLSFSNIYQGALIQMSRLRGFTIDPNTMIGTFAFCSVAGILKISRGEGKKLEWLGVMVSAICVLLSNSRTGLICFLALCIMATLVGYRIASKRIRSIMKVFALLVLFIGITVFITTDVFSKAVNAIVAVYANRSGLSDEYGRFTIWKNAISVFMSQNPWVGVGLGQMQFYTSSNRACHNTWLEMVCGSGILIGGTLVIYFILMLSTNGIKAMKQNNTAQSDIVWCMLLGTLVVMISLVSVDNMTYSYLWFGTVMLSATMCGLNRQNIR